MTRRAVGAWVGLAVGLASRAAMSQGQDPSALPELPPPTQSPAAVPPAHASRPAPSSAPAPAVDTETEEAPGARPPASPAESAERTAANTLYVEGLGASLYYSINVDHAFGDFAGRIGIGGYAVGGSTWIGVPLTVTYLGVGTKKHMFEIGGGISIQYFNQATSTLVVHTNGAGAVVLGTLILGYRLQPPNGGFVLRAGFSPLFGAGGVLPWPHIALGAAF